jgi:2,3-bisphosphoglycerate-independent phosphoglycerate mutase
MKHVIIIPDGAADDPLPQLNGKTPLEAAHTPFMDQVAQSGQIGTAATVPEGFESGSDVATMSLLGYDPAVYHTGRAPLEAAAQNIPLKPTDWVFRCNLVTTRDGLMIDHSCGGISDSEARTLLADLAKSIQYPGAQLYPGVSYRNLLVFRGDDTFDVKTFPPHEIPNLPVEPHLPSGPGNDQLISIMKQSQRLFDNHPVNVARRAAGKNAATQAWLWGQGHPPAIPSFESRFGVKTGAMITGVDLLRGIASLLGWKSIESPGMTSFHDTDYVAQGKSTCETIDQFDIVVSHIEAPDEASHQADFKTKIASIEAIDQHVVQPVLKKLQASGKDFRLMVLPDHPTNIATRKHGRSPTLWAMTGKGLAPSGLSYNELDAKRGTAVAQGHDLMRLFLGK